MTTEIKHDLKNRIYIASGWFTSEQVTHLDAIELAMYSKNCPSHSPRRHSIYGKDSTPYDIVEENKKAILGSNIVLASTAGKDMGTLWECGYAHGSSVPVVYYFPNKEETFNVMLTGTALGVLTSEADLYEFLEHYVKNGAHSYKFKPYEGPQQ